MVEEPYLPLDGLFKSLSRWIIHFSRKILPLRCIGNNLGRWDGRCSEGLRGYWIELKSVRYVNEGWCPRQFIYFTLVGKVACRVFYPSTP